MGEPDLLGVALLVQCVLETELTNTGALKLYEKLGFEITTPPEPRHYARSNVYMEWRGPRSAAS